MTPTVTGFFHEPTFTVAYLIADPATGKAAVIDPVLDFDVKSGRTGTRSAETILAAARDQGATITRILETHVHADHLTAAPFLKARTGAPVAIGRHVTVVQRTFRAIYNVADVAIDGSQFDRLLDDGESLELGRLAIRVMHTPGHTPACVSYLAGDAVFVGDTLFMPDYGTARCDFPGGDAGVLYRSIRRILELPPATRLFVCHDYKAPGRDVFAWETTVAAQRALNIHIRDGVSQADFVAMRRARDAKLDMPVLILPSIQVNMRAGRFPDPESNGIVYLKLPIDRF
jgi:glyoxylase-like metal-dependent hydrolase (beta-lactamase superfamily II)